MYNIAQTIKEVIEDAIIKSKIPINLEVIPKISQNKRFYILRLDDQTRNWIKLQPYWKGIYFFDKKMQKNLALIEEKFSRKYLELFGIDLSNNHNVHSIIKKFTTKERLVTDDFQEMVHQFLIKNVQKEFIADGVSQKLQVFSNKKFTIRSSNNKELYKGHLYAWQEVYITMAGRYVKFYKVFIIDKIC